ncbi:MAG: DUF1273 domain-containing protein [Ruminococcus sp.]|jgi:uncharacterized phage-like protein YoqJ|nr:DUF1273 domain-containing protein [Ruminococcus sp.]
MITPDEIIRSKTVCFSGHRTEKLPPVCQTEEGRRVLASFIVAAVEESIEAGFDTFITGGARGIDLWAAMIIAGMKADRPAANLKLVTAVPFRNQNAALVGKELFDYGLMLEASDCVVYVSENYTSDCLRRRNRYMIAHSSKLIAVLSNPKSGTAQTVRMARESGIEVKLIEVDKLFGENAKLPEIGRERSYI